MERFREGMLVWQIRSYHHTLQTPRSGEEETDHMVHHVLTYGNILFVRVSNLFLLLTNPNDEVIINTMNGKIFKL